MIIFFFFISNTQLFQMMSSYDVNLKVKGLKGDKSIFGM